MRTWPGCWTVRFGWWFPVSDSLRVGDAVSLRVTDDGLVIEPGDGMSAVAVHSLLSAGLATVAAKMAEMTHEAFLVPRGVAASSALGSAIQAVSLSLDVIVEEWVSNDPAAGLGGASS